MSLPDWTAYPTHTIWVDIPSPPDDDGSWGRGDTVSIPYVVLKKILMKHIANMREPWGDMLGSELLEQLRDAAEMSQTG
jgi:hypothetical protein